MAELLLFSAQVSFKVFIGDKVEQRLNAFLLGLFPDLPRRGGSVVEVMSQLVQDQTFDDLLSVAFLAQQRKGIDEDTRCFEAGVSEITACDQTNSKDFS